MRDKSNYRAANGRSQEEREGLFSPSFACPGRAAKPPGARVCLPRTQGERRILPRDHVHNPVADPGHEWIGIYCNGIHTY